VTARSSRASPSPGSRVRWRISVQWLPKPPCFGRWTTSVVAAPAHGGFARPPSGSTVPAKAGTGTLLRLLDLAERDRAVPDSWLERLVEHLVVQPGLPAFERQHVVRDERGGFVARVDGAFPTIRLGIEAHSRRFHFGAGPEARDEDRDLRLAALGWELLYLGWQHTRRPVEAAALVATAARERAKLFC
jgi:hypothetical protein